MDDGMHGHPTFLLEHLESAIGQQIRNEINRARCFLFLKENALLIERAYGSSGAHHCYKGGFVDHIVDCMRSVENLYAALGLEAYKKNLGSQIKVFSREDASLVLFLHDLEKPWKYTFSDGKISIRESLKTKKQQENFRWELYEAYGFCFSPEVVNALRFVEGEHSGYRSGKRAMSPLAAFCHMCDVKSSRISYDLSHMPF